MLHKGTHREDGAWGASPLGEPGHGRKRKASPGSNKPPRQKEGVKMDVLRILLAILIPPLGVFLQVGLGVQFWINVLLTLLGYVPGIIHAIYVILKY